MMIGDPHNWRPTLGASYITRLSPTSRSDNPPGYVVTVMGIDCMQLSFSLIQFPSPTVGLICMPVVFYLLAGSGRDRTCSLLRCMAADRHNLAHSDVQTAKCYLGRHIMKYRDDRLKRLSDLLSSVRLVKMYAWEDAYMNAVKELRAKEMVPVFLINIVDGLVDSLYSASSSVMILILFGTLAILDPTRTLSASLSFSSIYILSLTDMPTNSISQILRLRSIVSLGMTRIIRLCTEEEQDEEPAEHKVSRKMGEVVMEKCAFVWTKRKECVEKPTLRSVSLDIAPGSLVGVAGFVGSGKSSLLSAILGDMHCIEGTIRTSACELLNDINKFPAGDLTEIGEKVGL
ncbi:hypothetical protein HPB47_007857 [Ixodes persulcatus]|uniref:Uncharacterized protein n=1 Tax=Ixodes persulcatus TaxID=34615 RepID=A0AC60P6Q0_IXOPE|nr:hypothetical protein HPB47_007857 [Ixodes persulcatus]